MVEENVSIVFDVKGTEQVSKSLNQVKKDMHNLGRQTANLQRAILMFGLSTMFMGMQIQRVFMGIARSTIDTFMKINAGATPASRAIAAMSANFEFLKYSVGDALGKALIPFIPIITSIVESIADWVQQNPELTSGMIGLGLAIGTVMMVSGQLLLFFNGVFGMIQALLPLITKFAGAVSGALVSAFTSLNVAALNLGATLGVSGLGGVFVGFIVIIAGVLAALALIWGAFVFTERRSDFLGRAFGRLSGTVEDSMLTSEQQTYKSSRNMARWWMWLSETFLLGFQYIATTGVGVLVAGFNFLKYQFNTVVSFIAGRASDLVTIIVRLANAYNYVARMFGMSTIDVSGLENARNVLKAMETSTANIAKSSEQAAWEQMADTGAELNKLMDEFKTNMALFDAETMNNLNMMEFRRGEPSSNEINQEVNVYVGEGADAQDTAKVVSNEMYDVNLELLRQIRANEMEYNSQGIDRG